MQLSTAAALATISMVPDQGYVKRMGYGAQHHQVAKVSMLKFHVGSFHTDIIVVDCGPLDNPLNGLVNTLSGTTYNSVAVYSCNEGHQLTERGLLTCMVNGQWSSLTPTCDRKPIIIHVSSINEGEFGPFRRGGLC